MGERGISQSKIAPPLAGTENALWALSVLHFAPPNPFAEAKAGFSVAFFSATQNDPIYGSFCVAEREGFEPSKACALPLFESGQFNHSCTSPCGGCTTLLLYPKSLRPPKVNQAIFSMYYTGGMEDSVFTRIIKGEIPCHKIYEDERTLAFLDIEPAVIGHTLVVPKVQVDQFNDLPDEYYSALWATVKKVANNHQQKLGTDRIGVVVKGVDVPHAHVHIEPFNVGQHLGPGKNDIGEQSQEALAALAEKLRF